MDKLQELLKKFNESIVEPTDDYWVSCVGMEFENGEHAIIEANQSSKNNWRIKFQKEGYWRYFTGYTDIIEYLKSKEYKIKQGCHNYGKAFSLMVTEVLLVENRQES